MPGELTSNQVLDFLRSRELTLGPPLLVDFHRPVCLHHCLYGWILSSVSIETVGSIHDQQRQ